MNRTVSAIAVIVSNLLRRAVFHTQQNLAESQGFALNTDIDGTNIGNIDIRTRPAERGETIAISPQTAPGYDSIRVLTPALHNPAFKITVRIEGEFTHQHNRCRGYS